MPDVAKLIAAIDWAEENAYGSDTGGELGADRAHSIDLYLGKNVDPAPAGRSQVTDRSVFETIQWILPSLCRIFANGSDLVSLPPIGPDDEESAKQEAEYLNWVITQQNPWFEIFLTWATDALMARNAYVMALTEKKRSVEIELYERQTGEALALLLEDGDAEVLESRKYPGDPYTMMTPQGPVQQQDELYDVKIRRVKEDKKLTISVLPPENCKVSHFVDSTRVLDGDYFEYSELKTLSELRKLGFDVPDDIVDDEVTDTAEESARDLYSENRHDQPSDPAMRRVRARMIWIRHDYDEDGIAERQKCLRIGKEILQREEVNTIPVACIVPNPLPHRHPGMSITDAVGDIQRIKTTILRQGLDNLYLANNPQKVINPNLVNLDDCLTSIPGGVVRAEDVNQVRYEKHPFVFPDAMQGLEYMDTIRENRTGVNRYFSGTDQNALNKTATGIQTLSTMAAQRVEQIARIFGSGVEDLARIVHELILKAGHKKEVVKIRGKWIEVDPATWKKRTDFKIAVGFASGNKDAMVARLMMLAQNQYQALQLGIPVVQPQNLYETMLELTKASDFSSPERFWTDPAEVQQQQPAPDPQMVKIQVDAELKNKELDQTRDLTLAELALRDKEISVNAGLKAQEVSQKSELEKYRVDQDVGTKFGLAQLQSDSASQLEEKRAALKLDSELTKESVKSEESGKALKSALNEQNQQIAGMLEKVLEVVQSNIAAANGPRRLKRGKDGRAEAVELLDADGNVIGAKKVVRGKDGRAEYLQ